MRPQFQNSIRWVGCGCLLVASFAIWQNWFVAKNLARSGKAFETGDLETVEVSLAAISPFAGSCFLPAERSARIFGQQCDLALSLHDLATGLDLQKREYEMLGILESPFDPPPGSSVSAEQIRKDREGATEWAVGFEEYQIGPDPAGPLDDSDLVAAPLVKIPDGENSWYLTRELKGFKERKHDLARVISGWLGGGGDPGKMASLLSELDSDLSILRDAAKKSGWQPPTRDLDVNMVDGARLLLINFIHAAEQGDFDRAASAFEECCLFVGNMKGQPSIAQLLVLIGTRATLLKVLEHSLDRVPFPGPALDRIAVALSDSSMNASFPSECVRHSYSDTKRILATSMIETSDGTSPGPVLHLYSVTVRKVHHYYKDLAGSVAADTIPPDPSRETCGNSEAKLAAVLLDLRRSFSEVLYGNGALTKDQGRDAAKLLIESIAENTAATSRLNLGRIQKTIHDQWDLEEALLRKVRSLKDENQ
jgi:hypothetical protein